MRLLTKPFCATVPGAALIPMLAPANPFLAFGVGEWGISDTLRVAGAAGLIFVAAITWVILLKIRTRHQNALLKSQLQRERALSDLGRKLAMATEAPSRITMALLMKPECEKCHAPLAPQGTAFICTFECSFCEKCTEEMKSICPNCGGELVRRPRRKSD